MISAVGDLLPVAMAVALSPIPIIAVVVVLGSDRARVNGPALALGWVAGLVAVTALVLVVTDGAEDPDSSPGLAVHVVQVVVGAAFLLLAVRTWRGRPRGGEVAPVPGWVDTLDTATTGRSIVLGLLLSGANPKNLALTASAAASISEAGLSSAASLGAATIYVLLGSTFVLGATLLHLVAGPRAAAPLAATKEFMLQNNAVISMVVLVVLGAKIFGDGIAGLAA